MRWKQYKACMAALRQVFGVSGFRPGQKAAVSALLSGRDVLCILPTGAGKSLCWQLPAVMQPGLTVVVSPLIALMDDQVLSLHRRGIPAATLNSLMTRQEIAETEKKVRSGAVRILLVSPERLETAGFCSLCRERPPRLLVVDEAHCVVQWGAEFRPPYSRIGGFAAHLPRRPVICAMTATADEDMQRAIADSLGLQRPKKVMLPVMRPNLRYSVHTTTDRTGEILRILKGQPARTVIFCRSRARTEQLATILRREGFAAEHYHAGLTREARTEVQERFCGGVTECLAATTAFGMGVDIPDVRRVIHDSLPDTVIDLVQQSGRAGRDGFAADCVILISPESLIRSGHVLHAMHASTRLAPLRRRALMRRHWHPLRTLLTACMARPCIPAALSAAFGQRSRRCGCCSACTGGPLVRRAPSLPAMDAEQLRLWLLAWQRGALAKQLGVKPGQLLSGGELRDAARSMTLPAMREPSAQQAMERLMQAIMRANARLPEKGGTAGK